MITNPAGDPSTWPTTVERRQDGDGMAGFWDATFDKLLNRTAHTYDQLLGATNGLAVKLASQAVGVFGTFLVGQRSISDANQGNFGGGTLLSVIQALWTGKAGLAGANTFTAAQARSGPGGTLAERATQVNQASPTFSFATADDTLWVDMSLGGAVHSVWTASTTGAASGVQTVNLAAYNTLVSTSVTVKRDDLSTICTIGGAGDGFATLKLLAGRWRLVAGSGQISVVTPY
jgi:hypothetical protein